MKKNNENRFKLVRFAPSLTGELHIGNLASCYYNFLFASKVLWRVDSPISSSKELGMLRDQIRSILKSGITIDRISFLNPLKKNYSSTIEKLLSERILYEEMEGEDRGCVKLDLSKKSEISWKEINGRSFSFKTKTPNPIMITSDNRVLYSLASAIWDFNNCIDLVIRGRDLLPSTPLQLLIFDALGRRPNFLHHGLISFQEQKISKKNKSFWTLKNLLEDFPGISLLRWIELHSKKLHYQALSIDNLSIKDKILKEEDFLLWLKKDFRKLPFSSVETELKGIVSKKEIDLKNAWNSLKTVTSSFREFEEAYLSVFSSSSLLEKLDLGELRRVSTTLRKILWNLETSPSLEEALNIFPTERVITKLRELLKRCRPIKSTVVE